MSDSQGYRRALLAGPQGWAQDPARPVAPGGAALLAAVPVIYAPDAVLAVLGAGGLAVHSLSLWVALPVALLLLLVLLALRQVRRVAGPGGDVALVRAELGQWPAVVAAAALVVGHVLLLALSATAAAHLLTAVVPVLLGAEMWVVLGLLLLLGTAQCRWGARVGQRALDHAARLALWGLVATVGLVVLVGLARLATGSLASAGAAPVDDGAEPVSGVLLALVLARAVTAGSVVLAGVTVTGAGPGAARWRTARQGRRLLLLALGALATLLGILALARAAEVRPPALLGSDTVTPVLHQVGTAPIGPSAAVALLGPAVALLLAAAIALGRVPDLRPATLGRDPVLRELPARRPMIVLLTLAAIVVVTLGGGSLTALVPGSVVAVAALLSLGLLAGARRWRRTMERHYAPHRRRAARRARLVTVAGAGATILVLVLAVTGGLAQRSWLPLVAIGAVSAMMWTVGGHRRRTEAELALAHLAEDRALPTAVRAVVVVDRLDRATMRAIAWARAGRSASLTAVTVPLGGTDAGELHRLWQQTEVDVPLVELAAPLGERSSAVAQYVRDLHASDPHCLVAVYLPELLAARSPLTRLLGAPERRLRRTLLHLPRTTVTTVPWRLGREVPAKES